MEREPIGSLIERSSLGAAAVKMLRRRTSPDVVRDILARAEMPAAKAKRRTGRSRRKRKEVRGV